MSLPMPTMRTRCVPVSILDAEAALVMDRCCELFTQLRVLSKDFRHIAFAELLVRLDEKILRLAVQPDSLGERARACVVFGLTRLWRNDASEISVDEMVEIANIVVPCIAFELGRRRGHIQIEFPRDPLEQSAVFRFGVGPSSPLQPLSRAQLFRLASLAAQALIDLCNHGDARSRMRIRAHVRRIGNTTSNPRRANRAIG